MHLAKTYFIARMFLLLKVKCSVQWIVVWAGSIKPGWKAVWGQCLEAGRVWKVQEGILERVEGCHWEVDFKDIPQESKAVYTVAPAVRQRRAGSRQNPTL